MGTCIGNVASHPEQEVVVRPIELSIPDRIQESHEASPEKIGTYKRIITASNYSELPEKQSIHLVNKSKNQSDYDLLLDALQDHYYFRQLSRPSLIEVISFMNYYRVQPDTFIFHEADKSLNCYVIDKGNCEVIFNNQVKRTLQRGNLFGDLGLLFSTPRSTSMKSVGETYLWGLDIFSMKKIIANVQHMELDENKKFISKVPFFNFMTEGQKEAIADVCITLIFKQGQHIVYEGDVATSFYIIKSGRVKVTVKDKVVGIMQQGDSFGEQALYSNCYRKASVIAHDYEVKCLAIGREKITQILGNQIQLILYRNIKLWAFEKHPTLQLLTMNQILEISENMRIRELEENHVIFAKNENIHKLIIPLQGKVVKRHSDYVLERGQIFGDFYLYKQNRNDKISDDIYITEKGEIAEISFQKFFDCIEGDLESVLERNLKSKEKRYIPRSNKKVQKVDYSHYKISHLLCIKRIGEGQFSKVYLVQNQMDRKIFTLKAYNKQVILKQNLEKFIAVWEHQVLTIIDFPLINCYLRSFMDEYYVYFMLEFINGIELLDVMKDIGTLSTRQTRFYMATVVLALEYLHSKFIIYRDLKPENVLVDSEGYAYLIDMGTAKQLKDYNSRTYTVIGTPHYMAPEVVQGKGYSFSADLWSLGVLFYELVCGSLPYGDDTDDPYEIYKATIKKEVSFPKELEKRDKDATRLMEQLLSKRADHRLTGSFEDLKKNEWFEGCEWEALRHQKVQPPYVPPKAVFEISMVEDVGQLEGVSAVARSDAGAELLSKQEIANPMWDQFY